MRVCVCEYDFSPLHHCRNISSRYSHINTYYSFILLHVFFCILDEYAQKAGAQATAIEKMTVVVACPDKTLQLQHKHVWAPAAQHTHTHTQSLIRIHSLVRLYLVPDGQFDWMWKSVRRSISIGLMLDAQTCWSDIWVCCYVSLCMACIAPITTI